MDDLMIQKAIAEAVIQRAGDYVMALKGNQGTLFEDVRLYFTAIQEGMSCARTIDLLTDVLYAGRLKSLSQSD